MQTSMRLATLITQAGTERKFASKRTILRQGDEPTHVVLLRYGQVKVKIIRPEGAVLLAAVRRPVETLGALGVITGALRTATVITMSPCTATVLSAARFRELLTKNRLEAEVYQQTTSRFIEAEQWRIEQATLPARAQLIHALLRLSFAGPSGRSTLDLTQLELSQSIGRDLSVISAALRELRESGLITTAHGLVTIRDAASLRKLVQ
ncbi:Crp/Fnr family transcriptional regulator [Actinomadura fibrosa]|uniref:Crp/Fnr family transcriptional regulator n=1 Tax=Actinomadura fibrosa TaxID=111802 RepID=A0ABW2XIU9_9ACTN|nr:cyclic nucleotide-binding domain-containing protein [Actinomadura fibrosa]